MNYVRNLSSILFSSSRVVRRSFHPNFSSAPTVTVAPILLARMAGTVLVNGTDRSDVERRCAQPTAGIIVIGDEVLKGHVPDLNSSYLCEKLTRLGVKVCRISTIPDQKDAIVNEVKRFSRVARAFDCELAVHPELEEVCKQWFKSDELSGPALKLAQIPTKAKLNYAVDKTTGRRNLFPLVSVDNVFLFPGVPQLLRRAMDTLGPSLFSHPEFVAPTGNLYLDLPEVEATGPLNEAVEKFSGVTFGSYPVLNHSYYKTLITLEAAVREDLVAAENFLRSCYDPGKVVAFDKYPYEDRWQKLQAMIARPEKTHLRRPVEKALKVIDETISKYGHDGVALFFNGGKDCTATLHLVSCYLASVFPSAKLLAVDVIEDDRVMFPEVAEFIKETESRYNLELLTYKVSIKSALRELIAARPQIKAGFLGLRIGDPHAGDSDSAHFVPTDPDWPPLMRVYPILHFGYHELWDFIRSLFLPYCKLYDKGYTSLGRADATHPNPALARVTEDGRVSYSPAYMLEDASKERGGRYKTVPSQFPPST